MHDGSAIHTAEGLLGGAIGTLFLAGAMRAGRRIPVKILPPVPREDPGEVVVSRFEELFGRPLPWKLHEGLAEGLHWAYGIAWGGLLGLVTGHERFRTIPRALGTGAALGAAMWGVAYAGFLPALRLTPPLHRQRGRQVAAALLSHVAFGMVAALPIVVLDRLVLREPWYRRALRKIR